MKESKFIELLNLYVDHQISPADAAELEAEVRSNPQRRRVYRQYCMMQKGCAELGNAFRTEAPAAAAASKIVEFQPRRRASRAATYLSAVGALAACLAVMLVVRSRMSSPVEVSPAAVAQVQPLPAAKEPLMAIAKDVAARPALQPALGPRSFKLREQNADLVEASVNAEQVAFTDWMSDVRLSSMDAVSIDDLRFDGRQSLPATNRANGAVRPFQGKVEMAALRFQK